MLRSKYVSSTRLIERLKVWFDSKERDLHEIVRIIQEQIGGGGISRPIESSAHSQSNCCACSSSRTVAHHDSCHQDRCVDRSTLSSSQVSSSIADATSHIDLRPEHQPYSLHRHITTKKDGRIEDEASNQNQNQDQTIQTKTNALNGATNATTTTPAASTTSVATRSLSTLTSSSSYSALAAYNPPSRSINTPVHSQSTLRPSIVILPSRPASYTYTAPYIYTRPSVITNGPPTATTFTPPYPHVTPYQHNK